MPIVLTQPKPTITFPGKSSQLPLSIVLILSRANLTTCLKLSEFVFKFVICIFHLADLTINIQFRRLYVIWEINIIFLLMSQFYLSTHCLTYQYTEENYCESSYY